jgi:hypothetical protein
MSDDTDTLTVAQLIERLRQMPPDAPVFTEGCDCTGECADVVLEDASDGKKCVMLLRPR